jgi:hypothetical protein
MEVAHVLYTGSTKQRASRCISQATPVLNKHMRSFRDYLALVEGFQTLSEGVFVTGSVVPDWAEDSNPHHVEFCINPSSIELRRMIKEFGTVRAWLEVGSDGKPYLTVWDASYLHTTAADAEITDPTPPGWSQGGMRITVDADGFHVRSQYLEDKDDWAVFDKALPALQRAWGTKKPPIIEDDSY